MSWKGANVSIPAAKVSANDGRGGSLLANALAVGVEVTRRLKLCSSSKEPVIKLKEGESDLPKLANGSGGWGRRCGVGLEEALGSSRWALRG